jgi:hypothetical protein
MLKDVSVFVSFKYTVVSQSWVEECIELELNTVQYFVSYNLRLLKVGRTQPSCETSFCTDILNSFVINQILSSGSSVIIVSDYRLDRRGSISGRGKGFFL